jgi:uncharacterized protein with PQ loop repeat
LAIVYNVPQIVHVYRTKQVDGLSPVSLALRIASYVLIVAHGYVKGDSPILVTTLVGLVQLCFIQAQIWHYSRHRRFPNEPPPAQKV